MSILDSAARRPLHQYSIEELKTQAALYLQVADHDPN